MYAAIAHQMKLRFHMIFHLRIQKEKPECRKISDINFISWCWCHDMIIFRQDKRPTDEEEIRNE